MTVDDNYIQEEKSKKSINLYNTSLLMKGPGLFDYFYEETKKIQYLEVALRNCIDPIFIIPLAERLSKKLESINACWLNDKNEKIGMSISKNKMLIGELENNVEIPDNQVLLQFSTNDLNKDHRKSIFKINYIKHEINDAIKQQYLEESFNPNPTHWEIVSKFARLTFVPASDESRTLGAGGGDDND